MDKDRPDAPVSTEASENEGEIARREALRRLGLFAAYTTPTMMMLLSTKIASAQSVSSGATN